MSDYPRLDQVGLTRLVNGLATKIKAHKQGTEVDYDNTDSGLSSTNVQDAIDEIAEDFQDGCDVIVSAVTAKGQTPASNSPDDIAEAISHISGSSTLVDKTITSNGTYDPSDDNADGYSLVNVNVPEKVVGTKTVTANGTYNASSDGLDGYSSVTVNVPSSGGVYKPPLTIYVQNGELHVGVKQTYMNKTIVVYVADNELHVGASA